MLLIILSFLVSSESQEPLYNKGITYYQLGKYDSCVAIFKQALKEDSTEKDGYFNLGIALFKVKKYDEAIESFNKLINLSPNETEALFYLGAIYIIKGNYKAALVVYTRIIKLSPQTPRAYENRGTAYWKLNMQDQARADLKVAKKLRRGEKVLSVGMPNISGLSKSVKLPEIAIEDTIQVDPADRELLPYIGEIYLTTGDYDLAVTAYSKLIKLMPKEPKGYKGRAMAYEKLGLKDRVKKDLDKIQKLTPK